MIRSPLVMETAPVCHGFLGTTHGASLRGHNPAGYRRVNCVNENSAMSNKLFISAHNHTHISFEQ